MTRIISGTARGRRLLVPEHGTRPTSDRGREGVFNSLMTLVDLDGAAVLDLFAGTGALGLEALSRGAARASFVESGRAAALVLQRNIDAVDRPGAVLRPVTVEAFLRESASAHGAPFDLVFADPPYNLEPEEVTRFLGQLAEGAWLGEGAIVVLERSSRDGAPLWPDVIEAIKDKRYGASVFWYGRRRQRVDHSTG